MPYTPKKSRHLFNPESNKLINALGDAGYSEADACYVVTRITAGFVNFHGLKWAHFERAKAILNAALNELQRVEDTYEDTVRAANGDVPELATLRRMVDEHRTSLRGHQHGKA